VSNRFIMDDQTNNTSATPNVLGSAPTMGDATAPLSGGPVTDSVPDVNPAPAIPAYEQSTVVPESAAPVAEIKSDDPVQAALKRIEDKLDSIALKVGA